ncbi:PAS domain S-box protein [Shewanella olleyana]|uniref:PAS domain-containing hybrid sensor histidine kinase/response regulator n=1 Tax=Shewanella olleyana TaxID=135626 RepID=UPI00200FA829|nr:PAS domain S-box protein [Shewanella olleyana]MCL1068402.1 PAS domain S-box protein [Shewanella olleyana]
MNKKIFVLLTIAVSLLIGAIFVFYLNVNHLSKEQTVYFYERESKLLTTLIEKTLYEHKQDAKLLPLFLGDVSEQNLEDITSKEKFKIQLNSLIQTRNAYSKIAILNLQGKVLVETTRNSKSEITPSSNLDQITIANSDWFKAIRSGHYSQKQTVSIYGPQNQFIDKYPGRYDMLFGTPIYTQQNQMVGIWVNIVDFIVVEDVFKEIYQQLAAKDLHHAELLLIDREGYVLVDYDPIGKQQSIYQRDFSMLNKTNLLKQALPGVDRAIAGFSGTQESLHERKGIDQITIYNHFSGYKGLQNIGWSTLVKLDQADAFSFILKLNNNVYILVIFILLLLFLMGRYLANNLIKPSDKIALAINELTQEKTITSNLLGVSTGIKDNLLQLQHKLIEGKKLLDKSINQQEILDLQRSAIDSTATGIIVTDIRLPDQPIIFINKAFSKITGYSAEEVLGTNCRFLQGPDTEKDLIKKLSHAVNKGKSCDVVITNYTKSGQAFINSLSIGPVFNKNRELTHFIGVQNDITEEKAKEEEIMAEMSATIEQRTKQSKDSAKRLRAVFDTALDGTIVLDESGNIKDVNRSLELIFGRKRSELIDQNISILVMSLQYIQSEQIHNPPFKDWLKDYIGKPQKLYGLHKAGHQIPVELSVGETKLESEMMYVAILRDISFQELTKQRELDLMTKLHDQELIYRTAFNQAAVGISRIGIDSNFVEVNSKMCEILGYEEKTLLTKKIKDVTYEEDVAQSFEYINDLLEDKKSFFNTDKRYIREDGTVFWANLSVSLVRDIDTKEPKFFIAVVEDITDRKEFSEALFEAKNERDKLLSGINLASEAGGICNWSYDLDTGVLNWDSRMRELYGIEAEKKLTYKDWRDSIHPDDVEKAEQDVTDAIKNICSIKTEFRVINRKDNKVKWIQCSADLSLDENNNPVTMYGINMDLTYEKEIQLALERETHAAKQASKSKSRFLATMSHEIRTPMNGVIGMIDLLRNTPLNSDQKRMVTTIRDSSFSLLDIINDILDFSKIESGQIEIDLTPCDVLSLVEKTMDSLWISASNKNVELYIEPDLQMPEEISLDSVRVRQILLNIVGNAIKFSGGSNVQGKVTVRTLYTNNSISLEVIDNGVGISAEQQQKLFVPFSQADSSTTRKFGGTGLGLSITKSFTELMKGKIEIQSELGQGSSFKISIPVNEAHSNVNEFQSFDFSQYEIFISCSNSHLANTCMSIIGQLKHQGLSLIDLADSEKILDSRKPAVIITDSEQFKYSDEYQLVKCLLLNADPIERKGHIDPYSYVVGTHPLKPTELILGLAVLCGLESPLIDWSTQPEKPNTQVIPQTIEEAELNNSLVLVAEDQPTNRLVLGKQLESLGYAYEMAEDGILALELWKTGRFGLVLTDWHMPNMDGLELTRTIREIEKNQNLSATTVIAVTANAMVGESDNCFEAGMDDYIAKPIEINVLKETIEKYIKINDVHSSDMLLSNDQQQSEELKSAIDFEKLKAVIGTDDKEITDEILAMFWASVQEDFQMIQVALKEKEHEIIRSKSHAAKGASVSSGAIELSEQFKWIEKNNNDFDGIKARVKIINQQLLLIKQVLELRQVI